MSTYPQPTRALRGKMQLECEKLHAKEPAFTRASIIDTIFVLVFAVLISIVLRMFIFQMIRVQGPSMEPTFYTNERVICEKITYIFSPPKRSDVIICTYRAGSHAGEAIIKRVIGLPGETVEVREGIIYVNGNVLDETAYWSGNIDYDIDPVIVPAGNVFVCGDNRNNSLDSRDSRIGCVPYSDIMGKVRLVLWPLNKFGYFAGEK